eukprot:6632896-Karenia_brevis.AAC.1
MPRFLLAHPLILLMKLLLRHNLMKMTKTKTMILLLQGWPAKAGPPVARAAKQTAEKMKALTC